MSNSDYAENITLDWLLGGSNPTRPSARYVALYTASPSDAGGGTEVSGGSYARVAATFGAASGGSASNSAPVTYPTPTASWGTVTHFGVFDALTGGNLLRWAALGAPQAINSGATVSFAASSLVCTQD